MFSFSNKSLERLNTCHPDLVIIMKRAIEVSNIDFGISEGYRTGARQKELYDKGLSKIDGLSRKGKHNYTPSLAVDIYAYYNGSASYDVEHLSYLAGLIHGISEVLFAEGRITHKIRWGGNWDMDGIILLDQSFDDRPHFELVTVK